MSATEKIEWGTGWAHVIRVIPSVLTLCGLALGIAGVLRFPEATGVALLLASLVVDALDGALARRLGVCSELGARLDWTVDTALSYAIVYRAMYTDHPAWAVMAASMLIMVQALASAVGRRFSGRSLVTVLVVLAALAAW